MNCPPACLRKLEIMLHSLIWMQRSSINVINAQDNYMYLENYQKKIMSTSKSTLCDSLGSSVGLRYKFLDLIPCVKQ